MIAARIGDHIKVWRGTYWHHGIKASPSTVVHLAGPQGEKNAAQAAVREVSFTAFQAGGTIEVVTHQQRFSPTQTVRRARSLLGRSGYSLTKWNCESFATWAAAGSPTSRQVTAVAVVLGFLGVVAVGVLGLKAARRAA